MLSLALSFNEIRFEMVEEIINVRSTTVRI